MSLHRGGTPASHVDRPLVGCALVAAVTWAGAPVFVPSVPRQGHSLRCKADDCGASSVRATIGVEGLAQRCHAPGWLARGVALAGGAVLVLSRRAPRRHAPQLQGSIDRMAMKFFKAEPMFGMLGSDKKTVIITGASSGLGLSTAKSLAATGEWHIVMACRDFVKAERKAQEAGFSPDTYTVLHLDLAANSSVRRFVEAFRSLGRPLDCLVCNAAVYFPNAHKQGVIFPGLFPGGGPRWSADGHEMSFAANYLGHFLLCNLLIDDLQNSRVKPARCIILGTVTATVNDKELGGQIPPKADLGKLAGIKDGMKRPITMVDGGEFDGAKAYKDSKVCEVMMMRELHRRFHQKTGVVFSSMYPGCIAESNLFREHYPLFQQLFPVLQKSVTGAYVSEEEAGFRLAECVSDPRYCTSGSYYSWGGSSGTGGAGGTDAAENLEKTSDVFVNYGSFRTLAVDEIGGEAGDDERGKTLWELSEKLVALK